MRRAGRVAYDTGSAPTLFSGDLSESIGAVFQNIGKRFTFGGEAPMDQRIYYFNTKELVGNKYGTPSPVPFRVVDQRAGIDIDIAIRCFGEYSYRITNPILFYTNVCGNVEEGYTRDEIDGQLKSELMTALQPAFAKISDMGIRYSALPGHTMELAEALNDVLSAKWGKLRGIEIVSFGVSSVKASEEDEQMLKEMQRNAALMDPTRAAAHLVGAQASAMQYAAGNQGAGPAMAFMGMNMAGAAGGMNAPEPVPDGCPAAGRRTARPGPGLCPRRLDLQLRPDRQHRQILRKLRQPRACPGTRSRQLGTAAALPTPVSSAATAAAPSPPGSRQVQPVRLDPG